MTWYLVFIGFASYLGPMTKDECFNARLTFPSATCHEVKIYTACDVNGHTGAYRVCPDFYAAPVQ